VVLEDSLLGVHLIQDKVLECSCRPYLDQALKYEKDSLFGITATGTGTKGRWARARISCARHRHHGGITNPWYLLLSRIEIRGQLEQFDPG
jgi:hypothetical protein